MLALVKSEGQVFEWDRFLRARCQQLQPLSAQLTPKGRSANIIILTSLGNVLRSDGDEILCNAEIWYSVPQTIYWAW